MTFPVGLIQSKQVHKFFIAPVALTGLAYPAAATLDVSANLTTLAATAGEGGVAVPHQTLGATQMGWSVTPPNNRVEIYNNATGAKLVDANNNEVYGRLTVAGAVYSLALFSTIAGVETAFTPAATTITAEFNYQFSFEMLPGNSLVGLGVRNVANDPAAATRLRSERVNVTAANTLAALTVAYAGTGLFLLSVNGQIISPLGGASAAYTVAGTAITWVPAQAGYNLATSDIVEAHYAF